jgi:HlyD family type I secretion membrane fusion protein
MRPQVDDDLPRFMSAPRAAALGSLALLVLLVWAALTEVDVVVTAPAAARSRDGVVELRAPLGRRVAQILATAGERVSAGQPVLILQADTSEARWRAVRESLHRKRRLWTDMTAVAALLEAGAVPGPRASDRVRLRVLGHRSRLASLDREYRAQLEQLTAAERQQRTAAALADIARQRYRAARDAHRRGALSDFELSNARQAWLSRQIDRDGVEGRLRGLRQQLAAHASRRRELVAAERRRVAEALAALDLELAELQASLSEAAEERQAATVTAPKAGVLDRLNVSVGELVERGAVLGAVVPAGGDLVFEARVAPRHMAFLHAGLGCRLKLEALPFARYGALSCTVARLSEDVAVEGEAAGHYLVEVQPASRHLEVAGRVMELRSGATAQVDILAGRRTVLGFVTEPLRRFAGESLRER